MTLAVRATLVSLLIAVSIPAPTLAQDWPNLVGTWKGTSRAVVANPGGHYADVDSGEAGKFVAADLTIEWTQADNGRYIGTISSAQHTEVKLGVVSGDGQSLFTVDTDGLSVGRLIDADHFELCYLQTSSEDPQMVASCVVFERQ